MSPRQLHTSTVKKSAAAKAFQSALKNTDHGIPLPRSGAGSIPCSFSIPRIVPRPSL
jgi:hypothetical protein